MFASIAHPLARLYHGWDYFTIIYQLPYRVVNEMLPMALKAEHQDRQFMAALVDKELPDQDFGTEELPEGMTPEVHNSRLSQWAKMKAMMRMRP